MKKDTDKEYIKNLQEANQNYQSELRKMYETLADYHALKASGNLRVWKNPTSFENLIERYYSGRIIAFGYKHNRNEGVKMNETWLHKHVYFTGLMETDCQVEVDRDNFPVFKERIWVLEHA